MDSIHKVNHLRTVTASVLMPALKSILRSQPDGQWLNGYVK